jgi:hypothetical protein
VLTARSVKIVTVPDPAELLSITCTEGKRIRLSVRLSGRTLVAELAAIRELGGDKVAVVLQGRLTAKDLIEEGRLAAQPKAAP